MAEYVKFFDTTLRDGEQSLGFSMTSAQKLEMAQQLARLGVDVIEAGFPAASEDDFATVQQIARSVRGPVVAGLARAVASDIDQCWDAIKDAERPRIHTFLSPADMHRRGDETRERAVAMVRRARGYTSDVEFSPMDATRSDWSYVCELFEAVIEAGATTVNIPDTAGYAQPDELGTMIGYIREHVAHIGRATISVHCHDDLGVAVANSLAAVKAGARQIECCVNGIGERAGNAALEELVMALTVRRDHHHVQHGINLEEIVPTSELLQRLTGLGVQPNKAVIGANTLALEDAHSYAKMSAAALGDNSGRLALRNRLEELGLLLSQDELNHAFAGFKALADRKQEVTDADLLQLASSGRRKVDGVFDALGHVYR